MSEVLQLRNIISYLNLLLLSSSKPENWENYLNDNFLNSPKYGTKLYHSKWLEVNLLYTINSLGQWDVILSQNPMEKPSRSDYTEFQLLEGQTRFAEGALCFVPPHTRRHSVCLLAFSDVSVAAGLDDDSVCQLHPLRAAAGVWGVRKEPKARVECQLLPRVISPWGPGRDGRWLTWHITKLFLIRRNQSDFSLAPPSNSGQ